MMDILEDYCIIRNYGYSRLDGQMNVSDREQEVGVMEHIYYIFLF